MPMETPGEGTGIASIMIYLGLRADGWSTPSLGRYIQGKEPRVAIVEESWWAPQPVRTDTKRNSLTLDGV